MPTFSLEEVEKHNNVKDLWVINQNKVYDVTTFVEKHPGGKEVLAEFAGSNVTDIMREPSSHNFGHKHTKYAYSLLQSHYIGDLEKGGQRNHTDGVHKRQTHQEKKSSEESDVPQPNFEENITEDTLIDWNKPILWQVGSLGDKYMDWVHKPVDKKIRLFRSNFCEMCGNAYWWTVPSFWVPVILLLLYSSYQNGQSAGPDWLESDEFVQLSIQLSQPEIEADLVQRFDQRSDSTMVEMMEDLGVESSDHHLSSGCITLGMKVIGLNSLKNLLLAKRSGKLETRLGKLLLTPEITKGKDVSLKVEIQNEEKLQILMDLKDSLYVKEASEATSSQSVRFAYCAERRKWFWTPYDKNHIWMEVGHDSVQSGSRKGETPEEKYLKVIRFLRKEKPILERRNTDCIICDLVNAGKTRKPDIKNSACAQPPTTTHEPESGACAEPAITAVGEQSEGQIPVLKNNRLSLLPLNDADFKGSLDSGYGPSLKASPRADGPGALACAQ